MVLATCNRFEAYLDVDEPLTAARAVSVETVIQAVSSATGIDADELRDSSTVICDQGVAKHLFAVSSGLESVVVGQGADRRAGSSRARSGPRIRNRHQRTRTALPGRIAHLAGRQEPHGHHHGRTLDGASRPRPGRP